MGQIFSRKSSEPSSSDYDRDHIFIRDANLRSIQSKDRTMGKYKVTDVEPIEKIERIETREMYKTSVVHEIRDYVKCQESRLEKLKEKVKEQGFLIEEAEEEDDDEGKGGQVEVEGDEEEEKERLLLVKGFEREIKHRWITDVIGLMEKHTIDDLSKKLGIGPSILVQKPVIGYTKFLRSLQKQLEEADRISVKGKQPMDRNKYAREKKTITKTTKMTRTTESTKTKELPIPFVRYLLVILITLFIFSLVFLISM